MPQGLMDSGCPLRCGRNDDFGVRAFCRMPLSQYSRGTRGDGSRHMANEIDVALIRSPQRGVKKSDGSPAPIVT
jgi:hypothetical protein